MKKQINKIFKKMGYMPIKDALMAKSDIIPMLIIQEPEKGKPVPTNDVLGITRERSHELVAKLNLLKAQLRKEGKGSHTAKLLNDLIPEMAHQNEMYFMVMQVTLNEFFAHNPFLKDVAITIGAFE